MNNSQFTPFSCLEKLENLALAHAADLPEQKVSTVYWTGVAFTLNDDEFVVQIGEVTEILPVPATTPLPGVHAWARGVANVRGRLLPIVDLGEFLGRHRQARLADNRILVIQQDELSVGLVVDAVHGLIHFSTSNHHEELPENLSDSVRPFSAGHYHQDRDYVVFNTRRLVSNERFLRAAIEQ